jgi:plasmid stabilization system protein ParE
MTRLLVIDEEASEEAEAQVRYYAERAGTHIALRFAAEIEAVYRGLAEERLAREDSRQRAAPRRVGLLGEQSRTRGAPQRAGERSEHGPRGSPYFHAPTSAVAATREAAAEQSTPGGAREAARVRGGREPRAARPRASTHARVL